MPSHQIVSRFIYDTLERAPTCHASTIVELPNGDMLAAWYGGEREGSPDSSHYYARLPRGADGWEPPKCLWDVPDHAAGNPRIFLDRRERLWAMVPVNFGAWCRGGTRFFYRTSDDLGHTWSEPVHLPEQDGLLGKNKPLVLPQGDILLPVTVEYDHTAAAVLRSSAGQWEVSAEIGDPGTRCIQPAFVPRADGSILAFLRTNEGRIWRSVSDDRGRRWSKAKPTALRNNNSGIDLVRLANGHIVLAFNDCSTSDRTPLNLAISEDYGETWPHQIALETDPGEYSYPAAIQARDGTIHVTYTHLRTHIKHAALSEEAILAG